MKPRLNVKMQLKRVDNEFFAFSKKDKQAYTLDPLAFYIATLCDGKRSTEEISDRIESVLKQNGFELPFAEDTILEEIEKIVNLLSTKGVLLVSSK